MIDDSIPSFLHHADPLTQDLWLVANRNDSHALVRAARAVFAPPTVEPHRWTDHRLVNFLRDGLHGEMTAWWGPGASAKTADAALLAFIYWLAAPDVTTVTCCSTTAKMLDQRIWGVVKKLYHAFKSNPDFEDFPIYLYEGDTRQVLYRGPSAKGRNPNAMLRGVAIEQGSVDDAINNVIGVHNERMLLIVDEAQGSREALIEARINLRKGTRDFRMLLIGNPTSRNDPLGRYSEPTADRGYDFIAINRRPFDNRMTGQTVMVPSPSVTEWDSRERKSGGLGRVFLYNGFDAPSLDSEDEGERLHFLIQREDIERDLAEYGADHPRMWTFTIGFIPPFAASGALFTDASFTTRCPSDAPVWQDAPVRFMSIDPAFVRGGDNFVVQMGEVGLDTQRRLRIHFFPCHYIRLDNPPPGVLLEEHACGLIAGLAKRMEIHPRHIVYEATGNARVYVGLLERALACPSGSLLTFISNARATDSTLHKDGKAASEEIGNTRAEAYFLFWHFLERGHLSGVGDKARMQACSVQVLPADKGGSGTRAKILLESKRDLMKRLNGKSPDEADALANGLFLLRHRMGLIPGVHVMPEVESALQNFVDDPQFRPIPLLPTYRKG